MRKFIIVFSVLMGINLSHGAEEDMSLTTMKPPLFELKPERRGLWGSYLEKLDLRLQETAVNRLSFDNYASWQIDAHGNDAETIAKADRAISGTFRSAAKYALRDVAIETPFVLWGKALLSNLPKGNLLGRVMEDSIAASEEEELNPTRIDYNRAEETWWKKLKENGGLRLGVRPFRTSPYAFLGYRIRYRGEDIVYGNIRYYWQNFREGKVEAIVNIPLSPVWQIDAGATRYMERRLSRRDADNSFFVRLDRLIPNRNAAFFAGLGFNHSFAALVGFSGRW